MLIKEGNLLDLSLKGEFDIIINPSNCFHTPVSNLAKTIWKTYPFSKYIDLRTTNGNIKKLGGLVLIIIIIIAFGFGGFGGGFSTNNQNNS